MKTAHHMNFCDPKTSGLGNCVNNFLDRALESVGIAFFGSECAKLTGENSNVGIVDVAIENVGGIVAILLLAHRAGNDAKRVEVAAPIQIECVSLGNTLPRLDFIRNRPKFAWNKCVIHPQPRLENIVYHAHAAAGLQQKAPKCFAQRRLTHLWVVVDLDLEGSGRRIAGLALLLLSTTQTQFLAKRCPTPIPPPPNRAMMRKMCV